MNKQRSKFKRASATCRRKTRPFTRSFGTCMRKEMGKGRRKKRGRKSRRR